MLTLTKQKTLSYYLLAIMIFCLLFQDIILKNYFGTIARSPVVFIAPLLFFILFAYKKKIYFNRLAKYYFYYAAITFVSAVVILLCTILFVTRGNMYAYQEFLPVKLLKTAFYNLTYFFAVYVLIDLTRNLDTRLLLRIIQSALYFLFFIALVQLFVPTIPVINSGDAEGSRMVLTSSEPSLAAPLLVTFSLTTIALRTYLKKSNLVTLIIIFITFVVLVLVGSKGAILALPFALFIAVRKKISWKILLLLVAVTIPLALIIAKIILPSLVKDIQDFNSFSTRTTTLYAAFVSLFKFPFGQGYGTYLVYYPPMLLPASSQVVHFTGLPLLNNEVVDMVQTGNNIGAKSGVANEVIYNGFFAIAFMFILVKYYSRCLKNLSAYYTQVTFAVLGLFLLFSFLFSVALETAYFYLVPFVVLTKLSTTNNRPQNG